MFLAHLGADADAVPLVVVPLATIAILRRREARLLVLVAVGALAFQVVHTLEHLLQAGYWLAHPTEPAWLTPWAAVGRDLLAATADGRAATGAELLHLVGNVVFLAGLLILGTTQSDGLGVRRRPLVIAAVVQSFHVAEHVGLTATTLLGGAAVGVTNLFGALPGDRALGVAVRIWVHFGINLVATAFALHAVAPARGAIVRRLRGADERPDPHAAEAIRTT